MYVVPARNGTVHGVKFVHGGRVVRLTCTIRRLEGLDKQELERTEAANFAFWVGVFIGYSSLPSQRSEVVNALSYRSGLPLGDLPFYDGELPVAETSDDVITLTFLAPHQPRTDNQGIDVILQYVAATLGMEYVVEPDVKA